MPAEAPRELMLLVERVVRPLPMILSRRMRARKELLAHVLSIYAEELARDNDPKAALSRTRERFGDPQQLFEELRATVPPWEPWQARCQALFVQKPGVSTAWYAARIAVCSGIPMALLFTCAVALRHAFGEPTFPTEIKLFVGLVIGQSLWVGCFLFLGLCAGASWDRSPRRWIAVLACASALFALPSFNWAVLIAFVTGSATPAPPSPAAILIAGTLTALTGILVGILHHREQACYLPWTELNLDAV